MRQEYRPSKCPKDARAREVEPRQVRDMCQSMTSAVCFFLQGRYKISPYSISLHVSSVCICQTSDPPVDDQSEPCILIK
jgi:hypothetical protein